MKLEVGDRIYSHQYSDIDGVYVVERVTDTLAICPNNIKFKREYTAESVQPAWKRERWSTSFYSIETPELRAQLLRQNALHKIKTTDFSAFSTNKLIDILRVVNTQYESSSTGSNNCHDDPGATGVCGPPGETTNKKEK